MLDIILPIALQVSGSAGPAPATPEAPAVEAEAPRIVCTMEPVTGSRARKQKVCKPVGGSAFGAEGAQDKLRKMQSGGNAPMKGSGG
jgi:hypothetical protein